MKHFWQLLQTILEKRRERLNALKRVFLTFCPFISLKFYEQLFRVSNLICQTRDGRKALQRARDTARP